MKIGEYYMEIDGSWFKVTDSRETEFGSEVFLVFKDGSSGWHEPILFPGDRLMSKLEITLLELKNEE